MDIYCCECKKDIKARLTDGKEIYPHRKDLHDLPFWKCDTCKNYVGCHYKTNTRTKPLGVIPNKEIKDIRQKIHRELDPIWKYGEMSRGRIYFLISKHLGYQYHTANIKSVEEGEIVLSYITQQRLSNIKTSDSRKRCTKGVLR